MLSICFEAVKGSHRRSGQQQDQGKNVAFTCCVAMSLPGVTLTALLPTLRSRPKEIALLALQPPHAKAMLCMALVPPVLRFLQQLADPDKESDSATGFARNALESQCQSDIFQLLSSPELRGYLTAWEVSQPSLPSFSMLAYLLEYSRRRPLQAGSVVCDVYLPGAMLAVPGLQASSRCQAGKSGFHN